MKQLALDGVLVEHMEVLVYGSLKHQFIKEIVFANTKKVF
jgi:hypothetical protein